MTRQQKINAFAFLMDKGFALFRLEDDGDFCICADEEEDDCYYGPIVVSYEEGEWVVQGELDGYGQGLTLAGAFKAWTADLKPAAPPAG